MGCNSSKVTVGPTAASGEEPISKQHFDIERIIGQGGFGKVNAVVRNRGHDKGTWYAMKTLQKSVILERNHVAMVLKERNLLARLHCPQLVNMHYAFQDERHLYIIMDVCLGGDLHYQLTHAPARCFSEEQARFYAAGIVLCLDYMHGLGVMHRDIKPENLLLDKRGHLKVTDLGISSELVDGVCVSTSGTRPYMAPEIFMAGHRHSFVADFYSLGITVYQFLLGQRPYKPDTGNMKAIVRMATFIPPEKYTDLRQVRKILVAAQERKAPSPEFKYSARLGRFSAEARDFVQCLLICNPKYRLGAAGIHELMTHPWMAGIDWEAMRRQEVPPPYVPDTRQANCAITEADEAAILLSEEEQERGPPIPPAEQAKFMGFDYRTTVTDAVSGRTERVIKHSSSMGATAGDRDRAPTISVTQATEMLHTSAFNSRIGVSSSDSNGPIAPTASRGAAGVGALAGDHHPSGPPGAARGGGSSAGDTGTSGGGGGGGGGGVGAILTALPAGSAGDSGAASSPSPAMRATSHVTVGLGTPAGGARVTRPAFLFDDAAGGSAAGASVGGGAPSIVSPLSASGRRFSYAAGASEDDGGSVGAAAPAAAAGGGSVSSGGLPAAIPASQAGKWLARVAPAVATGSSGSGSGSAGGMHGAPPAISPTAAGGAGRAAAAGSSSSSGSGGGGGSGSGGGSGLPSPLRGERASLHVAVPAVAVDVTSGVAVVGGRNGSTSPLPGGGSPGGLPPMHPPRDGGVGVSPHATASRKGSLGDGTGPTRSGSSSAPQLPGSAATTPPPV